MSEWRQFHDNYRIEILHEAEDVMTTPTAMIL
jgi:hypothetical protein